MYHMPARAIIPDGPVKRKYCSFAGRVPPNPRTPSRSKEPEFLTGWGFFGLALSETLC